MPPKESQLAAKARASQDFVPLQEIRDGLVIMKDGSMRAVLIASSINFGLKSSPEQEAIIMQFQNCLNSFDFSVEFVVQSRSLDIEPYLETLRERKRLETNELLQVQIAEYVSFVKDFVASSNIVSKSFYIVVPYHPTSRPTVEGGLRSLLPFGKKKSGEALDESKFEEYKAQLWQRVDTVIGGLTRTGVRVVPLNTQELVELFYTLFNPDERVSSGAPQI